MQCTLVAGLRLANADNLRVVLHRERQSRAVLANPKASHVDTGARTRQRPLECTLVEEELLDAERELAVRDLPLVLQSPSIEVLRGAREDIVWFDHNQTGVLGQTTV